MNSARTMPCVFVLPPRSKPPGFQSLRICSWKLAITESTNSSSPGSSRSSASLSPSFGRCQLIKAVVSRATGSRSTASKAGRTNGSKRRSNCKSRSDVLAMKSLTTEPVSARGTGRLTFELELARDVRVEADELQPRLAARAGTGERLRHRDLGAVLAAAPQQPMKARRRDAVLRERFGIQAEHANPARDDARRAQRKVGIARIRTPNVRAERTAQALWVRAVGEVVQLGLRRRDAGGRHRLIGIGDERRTVHRAADHRFGETLAGCRVAARLRVDELPEALHVLPQLAHHEVTAVAPEVGLVGRIFGARQRRARIALRFEQG